MVSAVRSRERKPRWAPRVDHARGRKGHAGEERVDLVVGLEVALEGERGVEGDVGTRLEQDAGGEAGAADARLDPAGDLRDVEQVGRRVFG
jgi:hypothetical protein